MQRGQEAVRELLRKRAGEMPEALYHFDVGFIDLVWGQNGPDGYGLAHILEKHPEIVGALYQTVKESEIIDRCEDRIILLYQRRIKSIVSLTWNERKKTWLITSYEKIPS